MALPNGYTELEYIESSGTQYIDTGFIPNRNTRIDISVMPFSAADVTASNTGFIPYGAGFSYSSNAFECYVYDNQFQFNFANTNAFIGSVSAGGLYNISHNKGAISITGATTATHSFWPADINVLYTMTLFATHRASVLVSAAMRLYSCQIYDNGTLIRDYVPCINNSGAVGLYDIVNGVFYGNSGTGTFTAGSRVVPSYKGLVKINGVQKALTGNGYMNKNGILYPIINTSKVNIGNTLKSLLIGSEPVLPRLPNGYTEVEYIKSTGTQYIDTGFKHNNNTRVVMDFEPYPSNRCPNPFGACDSSMKNAMLFCYYLPSFDGLTDSNLYAYYYYRASTRVVVQNPWVRHTIDANKRTVYRDGSSILTMSSATFSCSHNLYLNALNNAGKAEDISEMKIYSCQIYDNGTLVRDFVPCKNPAGTAGLYDLVNGVFYSSVGSSSFTAGAEV